MLSRPASNTANRPTGPAPTITMSVRIGSGRLATRSFMPGVPGVCLILLQCAQAGLRIPGPVTYTLSSGEKSSKAAA